MPCKFFKLPDRLGNHHPDRQPDFRRSEPIQLVRAGVGHVALYVYDGRVGRPDRRGIKRGALDGSAGSGYLPAIDPAGEHDGTG